MTAVVAVAVGKAPVAVERAVAGVRVVAVELRHDAAGQRRIAPTRKDGDQADQPVIALHILRADPLALPTWTLSRANVVVLLVTARREARNRLAISSH